MHFLVDRLDWMMLVSLTWFVKLYLCFPCPVQIGPSQVLQCAVEWKHLQVSSGSLEMSSFQGAFCHRIDVPGSYW